MRSRNLSILAGAAFVVAASADPVHAGTALDVRTYAEADTNSVPAAPDNSGRNVRDQGEETLTPLDQSNEPADVELTQKVRKGITSNEAMSVQARNIKIITQSGVVTLRGPVKTQQEKTSIESLAKTAGAARIDNQLEIDRDEPSGEKE
jgi:hyperosmotically inducible periplasmic protein